MPFCGTDTGRIRHMAPSDARRAVNKGYMAIYVTDFLYKVYPGDDIRTQAAYRAIARFFQEEMQARQDDYQAEQAHWQTQRIHQQQIESRAQRELSRRKAEHFQEILVGRGLDQEFLVHVYDRADHWQGTVHPQRSAHVPVEALCLPPLAKR